MAITVVVRNVDSARGSAAALSPRALLLLLIEHGLLDRDSLISTSLRVRSASHRNHNFFVESQEGRSYFVKQGITEATVATVRREAEFYKNAATGFPALKKHLPGFVCFIAGPCVLVLELVVRSSHIGQLPRNRLTPPFFFRLGAALALLHRQSEFAGVRSDRRPSPLIARIGALSPNELTTISAAGVELIRTIQRFPDYETVLTDAFEQSDERCLTHNDFKAGNCLVGAGRIPIIVDWEFVAIGDPAWDVGCVLADFLSDWLLSMPLGSRVGIQSLPAVAVRPLESLHPAIHAFWNGYCRSTHLGAEKRMAFLVRATKCAGIKLSQSAYEMCQSATSLSAAELFFLQTSWNILQRPMEAIVRLFGISLGGQPWDQPRLGFL